MADAAGLSLSVAALVKELYDYAKLVKGATEEIASLAGELSAFKSVLDLHAQYITTRPSNRSDEFDDMVNCAQELVLSLATQLRGGASSVQRARHALEWPFKAGSVREKLARIERLKSWFLFALMVDDSIKLDNVIAEMRELSVTIHADLESRRSNETSTATARLRDTVAPVSHNKVHGKACRSWAGTESGMWFCDGPLRTWSEQEPSSSRLYVLSGVSGTGKTTLMSRAIEHTSQKLADQPSTHVAYFYCTYNELGSQDPRNVLGSWMSQIRPALSNIDLAARRPEDLTLADMESSLIAAASGCTQLLFLDALNESLDRANELAASIMRLIESSSSIRCLVSTTPHLAPLKEIFGISYSRIDVSAQAVLPDIEQYIRKRVASNPVLSQIPEIEFLKALVPKSEGIFRWVDCQMTFLDSMMTAKKVRQALQSLPGTLNETYALLLSYVLGPAKQMVRDALLWLSFSHRLLELEELCEAVIIEEDEYEIDQSCRLQDPHSLLSLCQGLVAYDIPTESVSLAHSSVKSFLTGEWIRNSSVSFFAMDANRSISFIVRKSLSYLSLTQLQLHSQPNQATPGKFRVALHRRYPFLGYASTRWATHARCCTLGEHEMQVIIKFFQTQKKPMGGNFVFWVSILFPQMPTMRMLESEPLYYAASYGLSEVIKGLFAEGLISKKDSGGPWYIDHKCGRHASTALQVACYRGHEAVVDILLLEGADPNSRDDGGISCEKWARNQGYDRILEKLRDAGATIKGKVRVSRPYESSMGGPDENGAAFVPYLI